MAEKTEIYLIGFDEISNFLPDIYSMKKIKSLNECNIKLNAVFTENYEKFLGVREYCSQHKIDLVNILSDENYFSSIVQYVQNNFDKKNLVALISEKKVFKLNLLFRQDLDFNTHLI